MSAGEGRAEEAQAKVGAAKEGATRLAIVLSDAGYRPVLKTTRITALSLSLSLSLCRAHVLNSQPSNTQAMLRTLHEDAFLRSDLQALDKKSLGAAARRKKKAAG